ncbi:MAG: glycosyltransferase, partial [Bacteroidetes bacterium]|nr:glycosyltransferase [Bacteroidota bacterium]
MKKIAFFIPDLRGGGAEKAVVNLLKEFAIMPVRADLLILKKQGIFLNQVPSNINVVEFNKSRMLSVVGSLVSYLKKNKPDILISNLSHSNVIALLANKISGTKTKIIVVEHAIPEKTKRSLSKEFVLQLSMRWLYPFSSAIVAVAENTSREIEKFLKIKEGTIRTIYNPVVDQDIFGKSKIAIPHQWFNKKDFPVILAAGRFVPDKDFSTLLKAFAIVRKKQKSKLVILGEGELFAAIKREATLLGISGDVVLPGFIENPYAYMFHSDVFVLSSLREGLPTVLIEA